MSDLTPRYYTPGHARALLPATDLDRLRYMRAACEVYVATAMSARAIPRAAWLAAANAWLEDFRQAIGAPPEIADWAIVCVDGNPWHEAIEIRIEGGP